MNQSNIALGYYDGNIKYFCDMLVEAYEFYDGIIISTEMYDILYENAKAANMTQRLSELLSSNIMISDIFMMQFNGAHYALVDKSVLLQLINVIAIPIQGGNITDYAEEDNEICTMS